jgi:hypothetical protein
MPLFEVAYTVEDSVVVPPTPVVAKTATAAAAKVAALNAAKLDATAEVVAHVRPFAETS